MVRYWRVYSAADPEQQHCLGTVRASNRIVAELEAERLEIGGYGTPAGPWSVQVVPTDPDPVADWQTILPDGCPPDCEFRPCEAQRASECKLEEGE